MSAEVENMKVKTSIGKSDQLQQWDTEIDKLKASAGEGQADARTELLNQIDELRAKEKTALGELNNFRMPEMTCGKILAIMEKS